MKNHKIALVALISIVTVLSACKEDFLHYRKDAGFAKVEQTHTLTELVSDGTIDIVWIIDNSGSMGTHQRNVINNTAAFISPFTQNKFNLKWKMGLISTSLNERPYFGFAPDVFDDKTPNPVKKFQDGVGKLGTMGDTTEKIFDPIISAFRADPKFIRKDAYLAFIVVTDTNDQSQSYRTAQSFLAELSKYKKDSSKIFGYGIFAATDMGCAFGETDGSWNYATSEYKKVFTTFGDHKIFNLCKDNFGVLLADIGKDLNKKIVNYKFYLDKRPKIETLKVLYNGGEVPFGPKEKGGYWVYDYDLNAVLFSDISFAKGDFEKVSLSYSEDHASD